MEERVRLEEFSLLGGPLHRFGCRMGLIRNGTNTIPFGLVLGAFLWIVLILLTFIEGIGQRVFSLATIGAHVRLLLAIPLFFFCEARVMPRMTMFVNATIRSALVPKSVLPFLQSDIARIVRWNSAWIPEALCLAVVVMQHFFGSRLNLPGLTEAAPGRAANGMTLTALWYWIACLPVFRFLMFRWLWLLGLWCFFLWRMSRLPLHLVPMHPDGVAGLEYLETVHTEFIPLILAISSVLSASFAEEMSTGTLAFEAIYPALPIILAVDAVLFLGPLFFFVFLLWQSKVKSLVEYMVFSMRYVDDFENKWLGTESTSVDERKEDLLGTADLQSLADLNNSVNIVRGMRLVPASSRLLINLGVAALLPLFPLLLIKYPADKLIEMLFKSLLGM